MATPKGAKRSRTPKRRKPPKPPYVRALRCPKCGNDGSRGVIRFVEQIWIYRDVVGIVDGKIRVENPFPYNTGEGYDDGENGQFECHGALAGDECLHRWAPPTLASISYDIGGGRYYP